MRRRLLSILLAAALLCAILPMHVSAATASVKNIILMIPDGGGFGNFDLAEALKRSGSGVAGQRTAITTGAIKGEIHRGLYLSDYLVGTSRTRSSNNAVTDSAAGGTAISSGYRTGNGCVGLNPSGVPLPSLLEIAQAEGKATGILTTSTWTDATPASFAAHVKSRSQTDQIAAQMLRHNIDIVMGGGSDRDSTGSVTAEQMGYTVVNNARELAAAVGRGEKRIWSCFSTIGKLMTTDWKPSTQPTLLAMTKAAVTVLSENENGFFLVVEGGCVDRAAHDMDARTATAEYLAFDEAFAYAVNWAKQNGDTAVLAVPDHDTGALDVSDLSAVLRDLKNGVDPTAVTWNTPGTHSAQNVGIWFYAPPQARELFLKTVGLPTAAGTVRTGSFYSGTKINEAYATDNYRLAAGVAAIAGLELDAERMFSPLPQGQSGVSADSAVFTLPDGTRQAFPYGIAVRSEEATPRLYAPQAVCERISRYAAPFRDVAKNEWFFSAVRTAYLRFWMEGTAPQLFSPEDEMSRAMLVTVLWRIAGKPKGGTTSFTDVPEGQWYSAAVAWASDKGIVLGTSQTTFSPDSTMTREQLATILLRYSRKQAMASSKRASLSGFADAGSVSAYAEEAMRWAVAEGILNGSDGKLLPQDSATRAQVAAVLVRFLQA